MVLIRGSNLLNRCFFILCSFFVPHFVMAVEKVATVNPISFSLASTMLEGTSIEVDYLPPTRLPMGRVPSWILKNKTAKFPRYDAIVTISSIQPKFDFFNTLRQTNIRISKIDMATAMVPKGEKVTVHSPHEYFWLNNNNLLLMAGVLKRDFSLMWPKEKVNINRNYQQVAKLIRQLNLHIDSILQTNDVAFIASSNDKLMPISASVSSDFVKPAEAKEIGLKFVYLSTKNKIKTEKLWKIDDFTRVIKKPLADRLNDNLHSLVVLFE